MELRCSLCTKNFSGATGQVAAAFELAAAGRMALVLGCGHCGALFFPVIRPDAATPLGEASTALDLRPRTPLLGVARYEVIRILGEGGMGVVLLARDRETGTEVCIKRLRPGVERGALCQEINALQRLEHPHIVRLLDRYEHAGQVHMVLEYVQGESLDRYLLARGPLLEPEALEIICQVLEAVLYAHERYVIHQDLKPSNVLLERRGSRAYARVLDFEIALVDGVDARGAITGVGPAIGTLFYMAPEQIRGQIIDPSADVYALVVMLAELLLGHPPYDGCLSFMHFYDHKLGGIDVSAVPATEPTLALIRAFTHGELAQRPLPTQALDQIRSLLRSWQPLLSTSSS